MRQSRNSPHTGVLVKDEIIAIVDDVTQAIEDAREQAPRRQLGLDVAQAAGGK
jgi:nicotinate-nucleotide pyrophosphorylase